MGTTRCTGGVATSTKHTTTGEPMMLDPPKFHVWFDDFDSCASGEWRYDLVEV